jgi:hypothetical protein
VQLGQPAGESGRMGSYESWEAVIGGILDAAGIEGFLDNLDDWHDTQDPERDELSEFLIAWRAEFGAAELTAREVVERADPDGHVGRDVGTWTANGLGAFLRARHGRVASGLHLVQIPQRSAANTWRVEEVQAPTTA